MYTLDGFEIGSNIMDCNFYIQLGSERIQQTGLYGVKLIKSGMGGAGVNSLS